MKTLNTRSVPKSALCFAAGPFQFAAAEPGEPTAVTLTARSGQPVTHPYWGRIVHDMAGFKAAKERLPLDYCHNEGEVIGYADQFDTTGNDLRVSGMLTPFQPNDRAAEVIHKAKAGVPYESSIFFDPGEIRFEELADGQVAQVNGYELAGPAIIVRQWTLRGIALCPYGADRNTPVQFTDPDAAVDVVVETVQAAAPAAEPTEAPEPKPEPEPEPEPEPPAEQPPQPEPLPQDEPPAEPEPGANIPPPAPPVQQKTGPDFIARFGTQGAVWFAEGKTWDEALALYVKHLETENTRLSATLDAIGRGEKPARFSTTEPDHRTAGRHPGLNENLSRFANGLRRPGSN